MYSDLYIKAGSVALCHEWCECARSELYVCAKHEFFLMVLLQYVYARTHIKC